MNVGSNEIPSKGFLALCYHYIRPMSDPFPRILGTRVDEFRNHIRMLQQNYSITCLDEVLEFYYKDARLGKKLGMLITFDDGLSDHFVAAKILAEYDIKATFFIPTCILEDRLPANPTIIHYSIAIFGLEKFLEAFRAAISQYNIEGVKIDYQRGKDDPWKVIAAIKSTFKYELNLKESRRIVLYIYENLLHRKYPDAMERMHLTKTQIEEMLEMGHSIGVHSRTHISVKAAALNENDFRKELVEPREFLERTFNVPVIALSYPYGGLNDCLSSESLAKLTDKYKLAFTVEEILNTKSTSPLSLGRYMPTSKDNHMMLSATLDKISGLE